MVDEEGDMNAPWWRLAAERGISTAAPPSPQAKTQNERTTPAR
jgi:hypothetical protein